MGEIKIQKQQKYKNRLESEISLRTQEAIKAKIRAEKANASKSEFLANISHELKTSMHSILSFSTFGLKKVNNIRNKIEKDDLEEYFREIHGAGESLMKLIEQLFDLSHLESGRLAYSFNKVRFSKVVRSAVADMKKSLKVKNIKVKFKDLNFNDEIFLDQERIRQVIKNFLSNSIRFSSKGKTIFLGAKEEKGFIVFFVEDEGIEVSKLKKEETFESFVKSSPLKASSIEAGLGFSIAKNIVQRHQGNIWVESNSKGGVIFYFKLPKVQKEIWEAFSDTNSIK